MTAELRRLAHIGRLVTDTAKRYGLVRHSFFVLPDLDETDAPVNKVRMVFIVQPEFGADDELAALERSLREPAHDPEEAEQRRKAAAEEIEAMKNRLNNPGGGLL